jgi:hypothetical protein
VIGLGLSGDHAIGDVLHARALDRSRGPVAARVGVEDQRDHHRRIKRGPAAPIGSIGAIERLELHRIHRAEHEPRKVILRQPLAHVGWHQERLLAITRDETLSHP